MAVKKDMEAKKPATKEAEREVIAPTLMPDSTEVFKGEPTGTPKQEPAFPAKMPDGPKRVRQIRLHELLDWMIRTRAANEDTTPCKLINKVLWGTFRHGEYGSPPAHLRKYFKALAPSDISKDGKKGEAA